MNLEIGDKLSTTYYSGKRVAIVLTSWLLSGIGVISSVMFVGAGLFSASFSIQNILAILPMFAWISLGVMSIYWVQDRHCHWIWPSFGTLSGVVAAISFIDMFYFYVSSLPLAFYLTFWHMKCYLDPRRYD